MGKLTGKQERFVKEYLVDLNATQAAIRAGYKPDNAHQTGFENLNKPEIAARIKELRDNRSKRTEITADRVLERLSEIAFAKADDFYETVKYEDEKGNVTHTSRQIRNDILDSPSLSAIQSFEPSAYGTKLKLKDQVKALEMLSRHLGLFNADTTQKPETNNLEFSNISTEKLRKIKEILSDTES